MKEFELTKESLEKFLRKTIKENTKKYTPRNFEQQNYKIEREEFMSDKCPHCMRYLNNQNQCEYNFCMSKLK